MRITPSRPQRLVSLLLPFGLIACSPFDEGPPDATKDQVDAMLTTCGVTLRQIERQDQQSERLVVSIAPQEPDKAKKAECLSNEEKKLDVGFTMVGP